MAERTADRHAAMDFDSAQSAENCHTPRAAIRNASRVRADRSQGAFSPLATSSPSWQRVATVQSRRNSPSSEQGQTGSCSHTHTRFPLRAWLGLGGAPACHQCRMAEIHQVSGGSQPPEGHAHYPSPPILEEHLANHEVTRRYHSAFGLIFRLRGTVSAAGWYRIILYGMYCTAVCFSVHQLCYITHINDHCMSFVETELMVMFTLWMTFTAFLFQSFVGAGLQRFNFTLGRVRSIQGRLNEIMMHCHSHASPAAGETLITLRRLCQAFTYVLHAPAKLGGNPEFVDHYRLILTAEEFHCLMHIKETNRAYALLDWMMSLMLRAQAANEWRDGSNLLYILTGALERQRGLVGSLVDSLDDAILPYPFANLMVMNVYIIFLMAPFVMTPMLKYYTPGGCMVYYWFLDGMLTFVFMADRPFTSIYGKQIMSPLINIYCSMRESAVSAVSRFRSAKDNRPSSVRDPRDDVPHWHIAGDFDSAFGSPASSSDVKIDMK